MKVGVDVENEEIFVVWKFHVGCVVVVVDGVWIGGGDGIVGVLKSDFYDVGWIFFGYWCRGLFDLYGNYWLNMFGF